MRERELEYIATWAVGGAFSVAFSTPSPSLIGPLFLFLLLLLYSLNYLKPNRLTCLKTNRSRPRRISHRIQLT